MQAERDGGMEGRNVVFSDNGHGACMYTYVYYTAL